MENENKQIEFGDLIARLQQILGQCRIANQRSLLECLELPQAQYHAVMRVDSKIVARCWPVEIRAWIDSDDSDSRLAFYLEPKVRDGCNGRSEWEVRVGEENLRNAKYWRDNKAVSIPARNGIEIELYRNE